MKNVHVLKVAMLDNHGNRSEFALLYARAEDAIKTTLLIHELILSQFEGTQTIPMEATKHIVMLGDDNGTISVAWRHLYSVQRMAIPQQEGGSILPAKPGFGL